MNQIISPLRDDPFANGGATPDVNARGYGQIMREQNIKRDQADYERQMKDKAKDGTLKVVALVYPNLGTCVVILVMIL